jgi:2-oxo-4-hydroxy-4-carboxy-5-ureidoimidazoline decarboxylase
MTIAELNALPAQAAREPLARCCGATAWVERMVARRPFVNLNHLLGIAHAFWMGLGPDAWREAFAHHPRIGDLESLQRRFAGTADLASREQAAVATASRVVLEALAEGNRAYEERFGYIFIVFASGRTADEMLALLEARLGNDPDEELKIAAKEQWKIVRLRLDKMLGGPR